MESISREHGPAGADGAAARVGAYLECLGLPADRAAAEAAAVLERCAARSSDAQADLSDLALADVMARFDAWLNNLCQRPGEPAGCWPGLLAWRLRPLLAENPDLFLRQEDAGDGNTAEPIRLAIKASTQPALPEPTPTPMPAQAFGPAPQILRPGFWRGVVARLVSMKRGIVQRIKGG